MLPITLQQIDIDDVRLNKHKYNTNNHGEKPLDYNEVINSTNTHNWIDKFHNKYFTLELDCDDLNWMWKAFKVGSITREFPRIFKDELLDTLQKYKKWEEKYLNGVVPYFIRCERVSLKAGQHGVGPYYTLQMVFESLVSTSETHTSLYPKQEKCKLYFLPWIDNFYSEKEFRIFVYNQKITAISQQDLYNHNKWIFSLSDDKKIKLINDINQFYLHQLKKPLFDHKSYCIDLAILDSGDFYFIEINSFGKEYSAGSSLFHWLNDEKILYNKINDNIVFRYA